MLFYRCVLSPSFLTFMDTLMFLFSIFRSNIVIKFGTQIIIKFNFHSISLVNFSYVMHYASLLWYWHPVMILVRTDYSYLRVRRHSWYQSITVIIHHVWSYFWKTTVRICLDVHIRTIVVLTDSKLTGIYFLCLLYAIYFSVMTHQWKGKMVSLYRRVMWILDPSPQDEVCLRTISIMR
jgi:hypothetical protein